MRTKIQTVKFAEAFLYKNRIIMNYDIQKRRIKISFMDGNCNYNNTYNLVVGKKVIKDEKRY